MNTQLVLTRKLWVRIAVPLVALALVAAACSGTETASAPDVAASDNGASDTDTGGTTTDNADADNAGTGTDTGDDGNAVADNENLDAYEGLNEGEIESAKREEEVRRVIARAEAADAEADEAETADAVETEPSETRETDTQSTDTQPVETQPSVPLIDADGTERLGNRAADYDPEFGFGPRTVVIPDVRGHRYVVDAGTDNVGQWVYVDARGPLEGETISRTHKGKAEAQAEAEAYNISGAKPELLNKYWNKAVPIRENLDIRQQASTSNVVGHIRLFGWTLVGSFPGEYKGIPHLDKGTGKIDEPPPLPPLPEGKEKWYFQEWYVYECEYALTRDGEYEEYPAGEGSLRLLRVFEIGTEFPLPGLNGGEAWLKSGATGTGEPGSGC